MKRLFAPLLACLVVATAASLAQTPPPQAPVPAQQAQRPQQPPLGPNEWRIDASHSAAHFAVRHMMVSTVRGRLGRISGTIEYDGKDLQSIKADVTIDVAGVDTQNESRDKDLRSDNFFDVANHPNLAFKSKRVEANGDGRFRIVGDLTIRGTTKEVVLDVEGPAPIVKNARGGLVTAATATTKIKRLEYGLKYNRMIEAGPVVGDDVSITIDLELTRPTPPGT